MVAMAYVLVLAIVALEIPLALSLRERLDDEVRQQAKNSANVVSVLARTAIGEGGEDTLQQIVDLSAEDVRGRVIVVDDSGEVVADSAGTADVGQNVSSRPEIERALDGHTSQITRESETLGRQLLATAVPITEDGRTTGAVRVTQDVGDVDTAFKRTLAGLALIGLAVLGVGLIAGFIIARQIARPLRKFEDAARAVADGDLQARAPVEGSSEQRELAGAFNEMTDRLAGSLEAQSRFVADASHQLRTPLTGMRLRLEEAGAITDKPEVREQVERGIEEVDRLSRMVDELLVLSQTGERDARAESIDLQKAVESAAHRWEPIAQSARRRLEFSGETAATVEMSRADLDRVIDALVENAVAYSPPDGAVELTVRASTVEVRDHGKGLGGEDPELLFERFHRGRAGAARSGGTGLGLAIARELARRWGGDVTIGEAGGGGAIATVTLPAKRGIA